MTRQIAYSKVILPSGMILHREVIVFDSKGNILHHFPLTEELPFVEWKDETFTLK